MTVYKAISEQARTAAELAVRVLRGEVPVTDRPVAGVPALLLEPRAVTLDDVRRVIVDGGVYTTEEICVQPYTDACAAAACSTEGRHDVRVETGPSLALRGRVQELRRRARPRRRRPARCTPTRSSPSIGDNGAGKSTLVGALTGALVPDAGRGAASTAARVTLSTRRSRAALGIAAVFQDLALCANLDVVENLFLGHEAERGLLLDEVAHGEARRGSCSTSSPPACRRCGCPSRRCPAGSGRPSRSPASLLGEPRVIVLDEPTAALGLRQTAEFLKLVERLRERGHGVVLISHCWPTCRPSPTGSSCCGSAAPTASSTPPRTSYEELLGRA